MPQPSSLTLINLRPPSSSATSMTSAPASIEFSTSSLTTDDGRSTTSPAAIWSATALDRMVINGIVLPKLPVLSPWRGGNVSLLTITLDVFLPVFGGVEGRFCLLRRHSRYGSGRGRLIRTLRWRRRRLRVLTTTTTATAASPTPAALFFSEGELVVPARIRVRDRNLEDLLVAVERAIQRCIG